jgi:RNA polymerase sigma-70 factor, ECF subfamily
MSAVDAEFELEAILPSRDAREREAVTSVLDAAAAQASTAWPGVPFPPWYVLLRRVLERLPEDAPPSAELARLHLGDLFLASACAAGEPRAMRHLDEVFLSSVGRFVRKIDPAPSFADEVRALVREKLFLGGSDRIPKIMEYAGVGPLEGWIRVVSVRTAQNLSRGRTPAAVAGDLPLAAASGDPELVMARAEHGEAFRESFEAAVQSLSSEDRTLLRLCYVDGLSSESSAKMYGTSSATVRRKIAAARLAVLGTTKRLLRSRLGVSPGEVDRIVGELQSGIDLSLSRILRRTASSP